MPRITRIDPRRYTGNRGEIIHVAIAHFVPVARVKVALRSANGRLLEHGWTRPGATAGRFRYVTRKKLRGGQVVQIEATATSLARKSVTLTVSHELKVRRPRSAWFPQI